MPGVSDSRWAAEGTTPSQIEAALRDMLIERHAENEGFVPARVLNMVCVVDKAWSGEIANRLRQVGRYHASRTIVLSVDPDRSTVDAVATIASDTQPKTGEFAPLRETVIVDVGDQHVAALDTIVDPLLVTDLPTLLWSPHGHPEAIDTLLPLAQAVLLDSVDDPDLKDALDRAQALARKAYVVDLAWLRSTPWRERVAASFDPDHLRPDLEAISSVTVRHHPLSAAAGLLLIGWLASRLGWEPSTLTSRNGALAGTAHAWGQDVELLLEAEPDQNVAGLAGLTLETASGRNLELDRGPGGLRARHTNRDGDQRQWTVLGASRGEAGVLGEGIRQALLRDPTYGPALEAANCFAP